MSPHFPFTAIIGQENVKTALLLISIDPKIGGVLLSGPRGSAKSTIARSLTGVLNHETEHPFVTVPLGASEEMVTGSFDLEKALNKGEVSFKPGLLAKADNGILYVDEVNLLADHLVDLLLDAAASGINRVERDAISHEDKAQFSLVGTMNPDEGELRPQLLDRFGLVAQVTNDFSIEERQQVVRQRISFDQASEEFVVSNQAALDALSAQLAKARTELSSITLPNELSLEIAKRCAAAQVDGFRADITLHRAAIAHAALQGRTAVGIEDIDAVEQLVIEHRRKATSDNTMPPDNSSKSPTQDKSQDNSSDQSEHSGSSIEGSWGKAQTQKTASGITDNETLFVPKTIANQELERTNKTAVLSQAKDKTRVSLKTNFHGSMFNSTRAHPTQVKRKINWAQTLSARCGFNSLSASAKKQALKFRYATPKVRPLNIILLDTSASTLSGKGIEKAKSVIHGMSQCNYKQRKNTTIVTFGNNEVTTLLQPQRAPKNIQNKLDNLIAGGGTPIIKALDYTEALIKRNQHSHDHTSLVLITDGRIDNTARQHALFKQYDVTIVDIESSRVKLGLAKGFADAIKALYVQVSEFSEAPLTAHLINYHALKP